MDNPTSAIPIASQTPMICFSHLRWDFVFQRPQHLMSRFARERSVYVFEEPILCDHHRPYLEYHAFPEQGVIALRPRVPHAWDEAARQAGLAHMLDMLVASLPARPILWFYTPMMYGFARHVDAEAVVYDCMDELAAFRFAPPELHRLEADLLRRADVVFTGGHGLFEAKRHAHDNMHPFPSSVDVAHFHKARDVSCVEAADQAAIPHPRLGFYGVIDERMDFALLAALAAARPDWHVVVIGPVVKVDPAALPQAPNLHFLGSRGYDALPTYLAGWDVALMPFARNEATRFISPTKTPEYLAAGVPVVSTGITDVVRQYGHLAGVAIADTPDAFVAACAAMLRLDEAAPDWRLEADALLAERSWDDAYASMRALLAQAIARLASTHAGSPPHFPQRIQSAQRGNASTAHATRSSEASRGCIQELSATTGSPSKSGLANR